MKKRTNLFFKSLFCGKTCTTKAVAMTQTTLCSIALVLTVSGYSQAALIESFNRVSGEVGPPEPFTMPGTLADGARVFCDRDYLYSNVPSFMVGADYIVTEQDDKYDYTPDVQYDVSIGRNAGTVYAYVWLDNRWVAPDPWGDNPPYFPGWPPWLAQEGWTDTGLDLGIWEVTGSGHTRYSSVFYKRIVSGPQGASFHVGPAELPPKPYGAVACNFYGIAVSTRIPEPTALLLLTLCGIYMRLRQPSR